jgi:putative SOS response-associated peptidase YedK
MILGVRACSSRSGITSRTRRSHRTTEPWGLQPDVTEPAELLPLLGPYPSDEMEAYPVSSLVGNVRNNGPELIERQ